MVSRFFNMDAANFTSRELFQILPKVNSSEFYQEHIVVEMAAPEYKEMVITALDELAMEQV